MLQNKICLSSPTEDGKGTVRIANIAKADEGTYRVVCVSDGGECVCSVSVCVRDEVKFQKVLEDVVVMEGDDATFNVHFRGNVVDADWYKDNEYIDESEKYKIVDEVGPFDWRFLVL